MNSKTKTYWRFTLTWPDGKVISVVNKELLEEHKAKWWAQICKDICGKNDQGVEYSASELARVVPDQPKVEQTKQIKVPTIHLNGTGADTLYEGYNNARHAVIEARRKLLAVEFHARDYYVSNDNSYLIARKEHEARLQKLETVEDELLAILESIVDQKSAIEQRKKDLIA